MLQRRVVAPQRHGEGQSIWPVGTKFEGVFRYDRLVKTGLLIHVNGERVPLEYNDGRRVLAPTLADTAVPPELPILPRGDY